MSQIYGNSASNRSALRRIVINLVNYFGWTKWAEQLGRSGDRERTALPGRVHGLWSKVGAAVGSFFLVALVIPLIAAPGIGASTPLASSPTDIVTDSAGDLFIVNSTGITVLPKATGTVFGQSVTANTPVLLDPGVSGTLASLLDTPVSMQFDASGDLFILDNGNSTVTVVPKTTKTLFGQSVTANTAVNFDPGSTPGALDGLLSGPYLLNIDPAGDLFITSPSGLSGASITLVPVSTGTLFGVSVTANTPEQVTSYASVSIPYIEQQAFDSAGNLFIITYGANYVLARSNGTIFGESVTANTLNAITLANFSSYYSLAFDPSGNLFMSGYDLNTGDVDTYVMPHATGTLFGQTTTANTPYLFNPGNLNAIQSLMTAEGLTFDSVGNLFLTDPSDSLIGGVPKATGTLFGQSETVNVPFLLGSTPVIPGAPTVVNATVGNNTATVAWNAPADTGGAAITKYTIVSTPTSAGCVWTSGPLTCTVSGLTNGTSYTFQAKATNSAGDGPLSLASNAVTPTQPLPYTPVTPTRICDTRVVQVGTVANQCNHNGASAGTLGANVTKSVTVTGAFGTVTVPSTATAVVLNVAVTGTTASSFLSVYPAGVARSSASNLNWTPGVTIPNLVEVPVGTGGQVNVYNLTGSTDVVIDVEGYVATGAPAGSGLYNALTPARICDTRAVQTGVTANQCNNNGSGSGTLGGGATKVIQVDGLGGVPASGVSAVALNVAVTGTTASSFLTAWPDGIAKTSASNLNWTAGQTIPNRVMVPVGADGKIDLYNLAGMADVIVDVSGWFTDSSNGAAAGARYVPIAPTRICDTRTLQTGVVLNQCNNNEFGNGTLGPAGESVVQAAGASVWVSNYQFAIAGIPTGATAAVLNVAVTNTTASSFLSVWPDDGSLRPNASDLNWVSGQTIPNLVVATLGTDGSVDDYNLTGSTDVIMDAEGFYTTST